MHEAANISELSPEQREFIDNVGRLQFWDVRPFLDAANILVAADEPLRALGILDALPGYYRDHIPAEVSAMKRDIYALLATPTFYVRNPNDELVRTDNAIPAMENTVRGQLIERDVKTLNEQGHKPHVIDLGPGEYWLAIALKQRGYKFTYQDIGLCQAARDKAVKHLWEVMSDSPSPGGKRIFVACELIEHLHHEEDIRVEYERAGGNADIIHVSTPKYTFDGRQSRLDWKRYGDLGHLRTYTPMEFHRVVTGMFPGYAWNFYDSQILHMRGEKV